MYAPFPIRTAGKAGLVISIAAAVLAVLALTLARPPLSVGATPSHAAAGLSAVNVNDGFADLVQAVKPAVVNISTTGRATSKKRAGATGA